MTSHVLLAVAVLVAGASAAPEADKITYLPGWSPQELPSAQFSGYLDIPGGKHLHYWFVECEEPTDTTPVAIWFNGGPGCSSLDGFLYEHGPFRIDESNYSQLVKFNDTWASQAHMLYIEAPAGVGFSYADTESAYNTNDDVTAQDNLHAVNKFFELFPEYNTDSGLFITGESYAGIYVPTLAEAILLAGDNYTGAPLKGIAVGNGCSGDEIGTCGWGAQSDYYEATYLMGHAFMSPDLKDKINAACNWTIAIENTGEPLSLECNALLAEMHKQVGNINIYNVFGDCISGSDAEMAGRQTLKAPRANKPSWLAAPEGPNACIDSRAASAYLNREDVMEAIHVVQPPYEWSVCGNQIHYTSTRPNLPRDTYPLLNENIHVMIYNGDWDACVPFTDNQAWTENMGYPVQDAWHSWTYNGGQVGGYATVYDTPHNFTFITVRGGRHEVPETAPEKALDMFTRLVLGTAF